VSRLFIRCGILNISKPYRPPRPVTGIALHYGAVRIYTALDITIIRNDEPEKNVAGISSSVIEMVFRYLHGGTEESQNNLQLNSGCLEQSSESKTLPTPKRSMVSVETFPAIPREYR
jgi:hypothetical protein